MSSASGGEPAEPLACPTCARRFDLDSRFCPDCEMPLVYVGRGEQEPITAAHERARKVRPEFTGGEPVKVGFARNLAEAQMIQGMLLEEGIPSFERRTRGFDVPDFLAAGPRDILVPRSGVEAARALLMDTGEQLASSAPAQPGAGGSARLVIGFCVALAVATALIWIVSRLV
jgi:hypothetical protein